MWSTRWIVQARGVAMHATRPCGQTCGGRGFSLHGDRPCIQTVIGCGVTFLVSRSCNQPCGARGVAAHASGAMRSDTRAATRLVSDWLLIPINNPRPPPISPHPEHIKHLCNPQCLAYWGELVFLQTSYPAGSRKPLIRWIRKTLIDGVMAYGCLITRRCNVAVTRRTVGCRAVARRTVGHIWLKVPSSGLCGEPLALDSLGWDSEGL
ncbi:hypothetical protein F2Q70_00004322 [Brassica cretica]|uniref:Uncharacterized protein n=1 Tax=Brassica cretica TaxID=69181 RepID=A0A8S9IP64_BRACR|nr:hypothetical protein F2Q68_00021232 [Brassica cretica]KAF2571614.1 hypothetical protein F2Q70_00004322 [Brassica cretica]